MKESKVIPGAEAYFLSGNSVGILICHGFNGTPQSMQYLCERFAKHGFTVYSLRLKGHGTHEEEMESCCQDDWMKDVEDGYRLLKQTCRKVFVIGQSMGGALAFDLAGKVDCDGVIAINAALKVPDYEPYRHLSSPRFIPDGKPDIRNSEAVEITYQRVPVKAVNELLFLMDRVKIALQKVTCPVLLFHSPEDHVVPAHCSYEIYHLISSKDKTMISLNNSYHVASLDYDRDKIAEEAISFMKVRCNITLVP
ncbi:alpha/beta fold hydrolase [Peribacillus cavernae]|uniref:Alpha/beta fold hydrolase n=1 Tax=Peribacillus cavernae TaxID=1674310 RepID=A0A3S0W4N9_9BACI|nr:alpha/beta fold hydrolase [Peribacillus cavernae]MDQ0220252.1 carboxylesterase [Peribacillus cavernae]RUQ27657.1 alpha/beta fold hydrolase [Peribacillus cavernae]